MGCLVTPGPADLLLIGSRNTDRFMDMTMQGNKGGLFLQKSPDCDAPYMGVQRRIVYHFSVQRGPVQGGVVGGGVKQKDSARKILSFGKILKLFCKRCFLDLF